MFITTKQLIAINACEDQVKLFQKYFPKGIEITEELCILHAHEFNFFWAAKNLLTPALYTDFKAMMEPIDQNCYVMMKPIKADYYRKRKLIFADYVAKLFWACAKQMP